MFIMLLQALGVGCCLSANPANFDSVLASARGGETILLSPGNYGPVAIRTRYSQTLTIEGPRLAKMSLSITGANVTLRGMTIGHANGPGPLGYGAQLNGAERITIEDVLVTKAERGIVINRSRAVLIRNALLKQLRTDGIDIAASQNVTLDGVTCRDFSPQFGDHPDCIQGWSVPGLLATSDISIFNTVISGKMQGIFFGNSAWGGFDRVRVTGSQIVGGFPNGIALHACRSCELRSNRVSTFPGSTYQARINIEGGSVTHWNNSYAPYGNNGGWFD